MNKIVNKFLLTGDKFMAKLHLREPGFTDSACGPFSKRRKRIQNFRETGYLKHIYKNELDQACLALDAAYPDSKDLVRKTVLDKILKDRAYEIAINLKYDYIEED